MASPPMRTVVEPVGLKVTQIRVDSLHTKMQCWNGTEGMPSESAALKYKYCVIDLMGKSLKFVHDLPTLDGHQLMIRLPVLVLGEPLVVAACVTKLFALWGSTWMGTTRTIDVWTTEPDHHYNYSHRQLTVLLPSEWTFPKVCCFMRCNA